MLLASVSTQSRAGNTGTANMTATIQAINELSITNGAGVQLTGTAGNNALTGASDSSAVLNVSHNSATALKVTAQVLAADNPSGHDITLTVSVAGGAGTMTLIASGAAQAAQNVWTAIAAGAYANKTITYGATCTASGTPVSVDTTFSIVVTFTSTN
jgi:hypothetical protein